MVWVAISAIAVGIAGIVWIMGGNPPVMIYSAPILFVWGTDMDSAKIEES